MDTESLWDWIEASVWDLPHKVECRKKTAPRLCCTRTCVIPANIVVLFGRSFDLYDRREDFGRRLGDKTWPEDLAKRRRCRFFKANDGSYVFEKH
jgi:hypothetical protein